MSYLTHADAATDSVAAHRRHDMLRCRSHDALCLPMSSRHGYARPTHAAFDVATPDAARLPATFAFHAALHASPIAGWCLAYADGEAATRFSHRVRRRRRFIRRRRPRRHAAPRSLLRRRHALRPRRSRATPMSTRVAAESLSSLPLRAVGGTAHAIFAAIRKAYTKIYEPRRADEKPKAPAVMPACSAHTTVTFPFRTVCPRSIAGAHARQPPPT